MKEFLKQIWIRLVLGMLILVSSICDNCNAQIADTTGAHGGIRSVVQKQNMQNADSMSAPVIKRKPFQPNPKKAGLYSALVPGLGQAYNRQYWKVPVVYAGLAIAGYFFIDNLNNYQSYRKAYIGRINNPYPTDKYAVPKLIYSTDQLQQLQNDYSKYLDMTALFTTIGYALQVLDAVTSAHLKNFDISRDISMKVRPVVIPNGIGMGLVMNIK